MTFGEQTNEEEPEIAALVTKMEEGGIANLYDHERRRVQLFTRRHPDHELTHRWVAALEKLRPEQLGAE